MPQSLSYIRYLPDLSYKPESSKDTPNHPSATMAFAIEHAVTAKRGRGDRPRFVAVPVSLNVSRAKRPSPLADRPYSPEELGRLASMSQPSDVQFNASVGAAVKYMEIYLRETIDDYETGDLQMAFVNQARVAIITTKRIIKHPDYDPESMAEFIRQCGKRTNHCLAEMERLKPRLVKQYDTWIQRHPKPEVDLPRILNAILARDEEESKIREEIYAMKRRMRRKMEESEEAPSGDEEETVEDTKLPQSLISNSHKLVRKRSQMTTYGTDYKPPPPDTDAINRQLHDLRLQETVKLHREQEGIAQRHREAEAEATARRREIEAARLHEEQEQAQRQRMEEQEKREAELRRQREWELQDQRKREAAEAEARRQQEEGRRREEEMRRTREAEARRAEEEEARKREARARAEAKRRDIELARHLEQEGILRRQREAEEEARTARSQDAHFPHPLTTTPPKTLSRHSSSKTPLRNDPPTTQHRVHPRPQRARSSLPEIIEPPMTTTSPVPKEQLRPIAFVMTEEQRQQGYRPSLQSPYSHTFETVTTPPDKGLLFQPNHPDGPSRYRIPSSPDRPPAHVRHLWDIQMGVQRPLRPPTPGSRILAPDQVKGDEKMTKHKWEYLKMVRLPSDLTNRFLAIAAVNTAKNKETLGLLMGREVPEGAYVVTHLVIPKQTGTSDSCVMEEEEVVSEYADSRKLITVGWIHTHPTQSCFMSSMDMHTQAAFQAELPEFIGIVCSPNYQPAPAGTGIFRLTDPPGLKTILMCNDPASFHPHSEEEFSLYTDADSASGHVMFTPDTLSVIADLRNP